MYYFVDINNTGFTNFENSFELNEENRTDFYEWLDINRLDDVSLYPKFIKDEINNSHDNLKLIITRE